MVKYLDKTLYKDFLSLKTVKKKTHYKSKCFEELIYENVRVPHIQKEHKKVSDK